VRLSAGAWFCPYPSVRPALKKLTGVEIKKILPTPNIDLPNITVNQKYLDEGST